MSKLLKNEFENLRHPKIVISNDDILLSDRLFIGKAFLTTVLLGFTIFTIKFRGSFDLSTIVICSLGFFYFFYDTITLKRIKIDLHNKIIYRTSINPLENLLNSLLGRPSTISFKSIKRIYSDYTQLFVPATTRYYIYIETSDGHKLQIGTFDKEMDANQFAVFLNNKIKLA